MKLNYYVHETAIIDHGCNIGSDTKNMAFLSYYD